MWHTPGDLLPGGLSPAWTVLSTPKSSASQLWG